VTHILSSGPTTRRAPAASRQRKTYFGPYFGPSFGRPGGQETNLRAHLLHGPCTMPNEDQPCRGEVRPPFPGDPHPVPTPSLTPTTLVSLSGRLLICIRGTVHHAQCGRKVSARSIGCHTAASPSPVAADLTPHPPPPPRYALRPPRSGPADNQWVSRTAV
jgi:hypothetical protein